MTTITQQYTDYYLAQSAMTPHVNESSNHTDVNESSNNQTPINSALVRNAGCIEEAQEIVATTANNTFGDVWLLVDTINRPGQPSSTSPLTPLSVESDLPADLDDVMPAHFPDLDDKQLGACAVDLSMKTVGDQERRNYYVTNTSTSQPMQVDVSSAYTMTTKSTSNDSPKVSSQSVESRQLKQRSVESHAETSGQQKKRRGRPTKLGPSEKRRHQCGECGGWFRDKYNLRHHAMIHQGIRPYKCNYCTQTFSRVNLRKAHIDNVHKMEQQSTSKSDQTNKDQ